MIGYVIALAFGGLILGAVGRLLVPGRQPMGCLATILCGIGGAFIGGFFGRLLFGSNYAPGFIMGALCSALLIWVIYGTEGRRRRRRGY